MDEGSTEPGQLPVAYRALRRWLGEQFTLADAAPSLGCQPAPGTPVDLFDRDAVPDGPTDEDADEPVDGDRTGVGWTGSTPIGRATRPSVRQVRATVVPPSST